MKLNLDMVAHGLAEKLPVRAFGPACTELELQGLRFFSGETCPGQLYLMEGIWPPEGFSGSAVCLAPKGPRPGREDCRALAVEADVPLQALANDILAIFDRYDAWDRRLQQALRDNLPLRDLAGLGAELLEGRVLVSDKQLHLLADSHFYKTDGLSAEDFQGRLLPENIVQTILSEPLPETRQSSQPYVTGKQGQYGSGPVYCVDLCMGARREATCALMEDGRPLPAFALPLFRHFTDYVAQSFLFHRGTTGRGSRPLRQLVGELLQSDRLTPRQTQELQPYQAAFAGCRCAVIEPPAGRQFSLEYIRFCCEELLEGSIALIHGDQVVVLLPEGADPALLQADLIDRIGGTCGISDRGGSLADCADLYRQACAALRLGRLQLPESRWLTFDRVRLDYLTQTCLEPLPTVMVRTRGFQRLLEHNERASADYVHTLRVWLDHEMAVTESAAALYLHRSSFLKRLDKLRELLGDELETPQGRLLLRLQLTLLK